jgi:hypothetical protein
LGGIATSIVCSVILAMIGGSAAGQSHVDAASVAASTLFVLAFPQESVNATPAATPQTSKIMECTILI